MKLKNPDMSLQYIEYFGLDPNTVPDKPYHVFFGRKVSIFYQVVTLHAITKQKDNNTKVR